MPRRTTSVGASLEDLLTLALPPLRDAQAQCPRTGPGRKPDYQDFQVAAMILCGVLKKKKSKSAQYACAAANADLLKRLLGLKRLPARSTFFERYKRVWPLVRAAVRVQGRAALREHVADATAVAADKSLVAARGPAWHKRDRARGVVPPGLKGVDREAAWGYSDYHGWVYGYGIELVVTAPAARSGRAAFPLLASVDVASLHEQRSFAAKIPDLPQSTRHVLLDSGYDGDDLADEVEGTGERTAPRGRGGGGGGGGGRRLGRGPSRRRRRHRPRRHYLCPPRDGRVGACQQRGARERRRQRRLARHAFLTGRRGRTLYARRKQTVEPFHATLQRMFELDEHVWHRGLDNNRTQILTAVFAYQLLVRYHWRRGGRDAQVQYLLDGL